MSALDENPWATDQPPEPRSGEDIEWRPIRGYEGSYEVSNDGQVRSLTRLVGQSYGGTRIERGRLMKTFLHRSGYPSVTLRLNGRNRAEKIHRLVLMAFVRLPREGEQACHTNGNPADNRLENLRWGTQSDNVQDAIRHGTHASVAKTHCPQGHPLSGANLLISGGSRRCRICHNAYGKKKVSA